MDRETRLKRLRFRATHRGTKEADIITGGFVDAHGASWNDDDISWFEAFLDEQDVDIVAWAIGTAAVPERLHGAMMTAFTRLDYVTVER